MIESAKQNKKSHTGNRYDREFLLFWLYVNLSGGPIVYQVLADNFECIPCERTLRNQMESVSERYNEGTNLSFFTNIITKINAGFKYKFIG